jgi:hypothetical protein
LKIELFSSQKIPTFEGNMIFIADLDTNCSFHSLRGPTLSLPPQSYMVNKILAALMNTLGEPLASSATL